MDAFESLIALLLRRDGYWTWSGFKVELTKAEKRSMGIPSSPRWELDLLGYDPCANEVLVIECKSYLDSRGVVFGHVTQPDQKASKRYKLFAFPKIRTAVFSRLEKQLTERKMVRKHPRTTLCLATGKIARDEDRKQLRAYFEKKKWRLLDENWISERLRRTEKADYENDVAIVVAKILLRTSKRPTGRADE